MAPNPDAPNITPGEPPAPAPRCIAPVDLYVERPDLGTGARSFFPAGAEIPPDLVSYPMTEAAPPHRPMHWHPSSAEHGAS